LPLSISHASSPMPHPSRLHFPSLPPLGHLAKQHPNVQFHRGETANVRYQPGGNCRGEGPDWWCRRWGYDWPSSSSSSSSTHQAERQLVRAQVGSLISPVSFFLLRRATDTPTPAASPENQKKLNLSHHPSLPSFHPSIHSNHNSLPLFHPSIPHLVSCFSSLSRTPAAGCKILLGGGGKGFSKSLKLPPHPSHSPSPSSFHSRLPRDFPPNQHPR